MTISRVALVGAGATAAAAAVLFRREQSRRTTERFAAAALETLLNAIDANDPQTGAHVRRVAAYSLILGEAAELSEHECKSIERVALFHDIGKIHEAIIDIVRDDLAIQTESRSRVVRPRPGRDEQGERADVLGLGPGAGDGVVVALEVVESGIGVGR